jgi:hypothetical protein
MTRMQPSLEEIDNLYIQIQDRFDPSEGYHDSLTEEERAAYQATQPEVSRIYNLAINKVNMVVPQLSPEEIIIGYKKGSRLLRRNLGGYICRDFVPTYIPLMREAIQAGDLPSARHFLSALAQHLGQDAAPIVLETLNHPQALLRETAAYVAEELGLVQAVPQLQSLLQEPSQEVVRAAQQALDKLQKTAQ